MADYMAPFMGQTALSPVMGGDELLMYRPSQQPGPAAAAPPLRLTYAWEAFSGAATPAAPTWPQVSAPARSAGGASAGVAAAAATPDVAELQARLNDRFPRAEAAGLQPEHLLGIGWSDLSAGQLDVLQEVLLQTLEHVVEARISHRAEQAVRDALKAQQQGHSASSAQ